MIWAHVVTHGPRPWSLVRVMTTRAPSAIRSARRYVDAEIEPRLGVPTGRRRPGGVAGLFRAAVPDHRVDGGGVVEVTAVVARVDANGLAGEGQLSRDRPRSAVARATRWGSTDRMPCCAR